MKKNRILDIAIVICKLIKVLHVLVFVIITGVFLHLQIKPSDYDKIEINFKSFLEDSNRTNMISMYGHDIVKGGEIAEDEKYTLSNLNVSSLYINYIKYSILTLLFFLCVTEFQKVIQSVKKKETFKTLNVTYFKKIGKYLLIAFFLNIYTSFSFSYGKTYAIKFNVTFLILSVLAFVFAEIFKEGNVLEEENKLTV